MTVQETLKRIESQRDEAGIAFLGNIYLEVPDYFNVVNALEKQIPKKPFDVSTPAAKWGLCPNCEGKTNMIGKSPNRVFENQKYCMDCGQALDWSDT